jgi:hypothetical protein
LTTKEIDVGISRILIVTMLEFKTPAGVIAVALRAWLPSQLAFKGIGYEKENFPPDEVFAKVRFVPSIWIVTI